MNSCSFRNSNTYTALPIGWCIVLAIVAVLSVQILKECGIKPLFKKKWKLVESKKAKKLEMEDLKEIDFHNINSRVLKNYLSSQKNIPFDEIRPSFEKNINIIKNRKLSHQTQEKFDAKIIKDGFQNYEIINYHISNLFPKMNYLKNNEH